MIVVRTLLGFGVSWCRARVGIRHNTHIWLHLIMSFSQIIISVGVVSCPCLWFIAFERLYTLWRVVGPFHHKSCQCGKQYFLAIMDDCTIFIWICKLDSLPHSLFLSHTISETNQVIWTDNAKETLINILSKECRCSSSDFLQITPIGF